MTPVVAVVTRLTLPNWPDTDSIFEPRVTVGTSYRVDLDSQEEATWKNTDHPEWGTKRIRVIRDLHGGFLPLACLRIES